MIEADESDRSLLNYTPEIAVLTNCELDHHATYSSRLDLERTFAEFTGRARIAVVWDRPELLAIAAGAGEVVPYDAQRPQLTPAGARFAWRGLDVQLAVPGLHNAVNAAGALSACAAAGADPAAAVAAIADFQGARRRMERLGVTASGALIYDDYAHHPMKVAAAIAAARTLAPRRLVAVFQPHLYSRTRALARGVRGGAGRRRHLRRRRRLSGARARPRTFRASTGTWWPRRRPTPPAAARSPGCARSTTRANGSRRRCVPATSAC